MIIKDVYEYCENIEEEDNCIKRFFAICFDDDTQIVFYITIQCDITDRNYVCKYCAICNPLL